MHDQVLTAGLMIHAVGGKAGGIVSHSKRGVPVGKIEHLDGPNHIMLKPNEPLKGHSQLWFPRSWIEGVDEEVVYVGKTPQEFKEQLIAENPNKGLRRVADKSVTAAAESEQPLTFVISVPIEGTQVAANG